MEHFFLFLWINLLHCRCLMPKFPEILILLCRKIFSVFIWFFTKLFPIAVVVLLYKNLIFFFFNKSSFIQSWLIWATFHTASRQQFLLLISDLIWKTFSQNTFQQWSRSLMFLKIGLLINFLIIARKNMCRDLFLIKLNACGL